MEEIIARVVAAEVLDGDGGAENARDVKHARRITAGAEAAAGEGGARAESVYPKPRKAIKRRERPACLL